MLWGQFFITDSELAKCQRLQPLLQILLIRQWEGTRLTFQTLEYFSIDQPPRVKLRDADTISGRYYFRLWVANHPGTLAAIAAVHAKHGISIASVIQHEGGDGRPQRDPVPLVIMTHVATEGAARLATADLESLESVTGPVVRLRVKN